MTRGRTSVTTKGALFPISIVADAAPPLTDLLLTAKGASDRVLANEKRTTQPSRAVDFSSSRAHSDSTGGRRAQP